MPTHASCGSLPATSPAAQSVCPTSTGEPVKPQTSNLKPQTSNRTTRKTHSRAHDLSAGSAVA
eukprot:5739022-Prymnesium_polylepis.1